jgi:hypothetical protein
MERQKMAVCQRYFFLNFIKVYNVQFHSDSERGLGPVIASLSLGSPALMHFRLRAKYEPNRDENRKIAFTLVLRHVSSQSDPRSHFS